MYSIVHFSTADNEGGSARSAYRIHTGLRKLGHNSKMLVGKKVTNDPDVDTVAGNFFGRVVDRFADYYNRFTGRQYLYVPSSKRVLSHPWVRQANIIQLYNTHGGYFSHTILPQLNKIAPIVWRLSDMWPFTTHAAYSFGCDCYKNGPDNCTCKLSSYPPIYRDTKKMLWEVKKRIYSQCKITVVAPSSWIEKLARESLLFSHFPIVHIPNGIDLNIFYPKNRAEARAKFGIDPKAKVILFSAHGLDNNPRKGSAALIEALNRLGNMPNTILLLAGEGGQSFVGKVPLPVKLLGYINDQNTMAQVYSAADIIVAPSIVENLPNNLLEAMACGLPAVGFDTGGMKDSIHHEKTGYLAKHADIVDFSHGIKLLMNNDKLREILSLNARKLIETQFDKEKEIQSFLSLYKKLVHIK